jgi:hypothetical protein
MGSELKLSLKGLMIIRKKRDLRVLEIACKIKMC